MGVLFRVYVGFLVILGFHIVNTRSCCDQGGHVIMKALNGGGWPLGGCPVAPFCQLLVTTIALVAHIWPRWQTEQTSSGFGPHPLLSDHQGHSGLIARHGLVSPA